MPNAEVTVRFLSRKDVIAAGALDIPAAIRDVEDALRLSGAGDTVMPVEAALHWGGTQGGVPSEAGAYALPAYLGGPAPVAGIKWTAHRAGDAPEGDPRVMGLIVLTDPRSGRPYAVMESALVGAVRTAATTAVAIGHLGRADAARITVIGAGLHARTHLRMLVAVVPRAGRVIIANRTPERAAEAAAELRREVPWEIDAQPLGAAAVRDAEIVIGCTAAGSPFFEAAWVHPRMLAVSVGPFEFTYEAMKTFVAVVVDGWGDYKQTSLKGLFRMYRDGQFDESDVATDLAHLVIAGNPVPATASVYVNVFGLSILDIAVASRIARHAEVRGLGRDMPLFETPSEGDERRPVAESAGRRATWRGEVVSMHIARSAGAPTEAVAEVRALAGRGLEGDRYFAGNGTWSGSRTAGQVTLIEMETIEALRREHGIALGQGDSRRNIVTRGVALPHLIGRAFRVGTVAMRGLRLVEPCDHLARLTDRRVLSALVHRGGLRAEILTDGVIRTGDVIEPA